MVNITKSCSSFNDTMINWPESPANFTVYSICPEMLGASSNAKAFRHCHSSGRWTDIMGRPVIDNSQSYSNYSQCLTDLFTDLANSENYELTKAVYDRLCIISILGLVLGMITLSISIFILHKYRHLRNHRTRIHRQLFISLLVEGFIQLILYSEVISKDLQTTNNSTITENITGIKSIIWNIRIIAYEYMTTAVFLWMLIEGIHIHNIIAVNVFHGRYRFNYYLFLGWIVPIPVTLLWVFFMTIEYSFNKKWIVLHHLRIYWILNSFRLSSIMINVCFLINVIRILLQRMRANNSPEMCQVRKAVKAAIFLIPLLGIINFIQVLKADFDSSWFLILSFLQAIMPSWQGFLVSLIYCLINKEVIQAVRYSYRRYKTRNDIQTETKLNTSGSCPKSHFIFNKHSINSSFMTNMEMKCISENREVTDNDMGLISQIES